VDASIASLQEVEPLKQLEVNITRTFAWQHVRSSSGFFNVNTVP